MRWPSTLLVALALATAAGPASARPPAPRTTSAPEPTSENDKVEAAKRAWSAGDWTRVRTLLEPLVQGDRNLAEALLNETALRYLADATLQDEATLDAPIRTELATGYIERLLASSPDWRPPMEIHGRQFYLLYNELREKRDRAQARECIGEKAACMADLGETNARVAKLQADYAQLKKAFGEQEVEVREKVARNRAVALIPFGVGHFYNGRRSLGATFLAGELVFGGVGLGLLIARNFTCSRQDGFRPGSLSCQGEGDGDPVVHRRWAEQAMGYAFIGSVILDVVLAQVTFRPFLTVKTTRVRRRDLDAAPDADASTPQRGGRQGTPTGDPPAPRSRRQTRDTLQLRPAPTFVPGGGGLGVSLRF